MGGQGLNWVVEPCYDDDDDDDYLYLNKNGSNLDILNYSMSSKFH
jgi:hypothetical protein